MTDPRVAAFLGLVGGFLLSELQREIRWRRRKRAARDLVAAEKTPTDADDKAAHDNYADIGGKG